MENSLNKLSDKTRGLFDQKGGTLGMVILALGVIFLIFKLPVIVDFVDSLFHLIIVSVATAGVLYVLLDKRVRNIVGTLYMFGIRFMMGMVIKMDPIAILEDGIRRMYQAIANVEEKMGKLNGIRLRLKDNINKKKKELEECLERRRVAEQHNKKDLMVLEDRQSVRLVNLTKEYMELSESAENWYKTLSKIAEMATLTVKDAENEVAAQKERYDMVKTSHSAFKSAISVLKGNPDELAMFNEAFQYVNNDIMSKVGEMDRVIMTTGGMLDQIDLEKEVFSIKGADISKKYEELGIDSLFSKFEVLPSEKMQTITQEVTVPTSAPVTQSQSSSKKYF